MTVCSKCGGNAEKLRRGVCKRCYTSVRSREMAYGRWESDRVDPGPVREHVAALKAAGVSYRQLVKLSGVSRSALCTLLYGKPGRPPAVWVAKATADRLLAVAIPETAAAVAADHDLVPALGAKRRLRALIAAGWTRTHLAAELGTTPSTLVMILHHQEQVTARRHRQIAALFNRLQLEPGPSVYARAYGKKRRWPLPMQWDEEALDDPAAVPAPRSRRYPRVVA